MFSCTRNDNVHPALDDGPGDNPIGNNAEVSPAVNIDIGLGVFLSTLLYRKC